MLLYARNGKFIKNKRNRKVGHDVAAPLEFMEVYTWPVRKMPSFLIRPKYTQIVPEQSYLFNLKQGRKFPPFLIALSWVPFPLCLDKASTHEEYPSSKPPFYPRPSPTNYSRQQPSQNTILNLLKRAQTLLNCLGYYLFPLSGNQVTWKGTLGFQKVLNQEWRQYFGPKKLWIIK